MKNLILLTGLPRAGSTLVAAILSQNPELFVTRTSPLVDVIADTNRNWDGYESVRCGGSVTDAIKVNVLKGIVAGYFRGVAQQTVIDKNRGWAGYVSLVETITGEQAKMIVTVRPVSQIVASWERLWRKNNALHTIPSTDDTLQNRINFYLRADGPTARAYHALQSIYERGLQDRLTILDHNQFIDNPHADLMRIYNDVINIPARALAGSEGPGHKPPRRPEIPVSLKERECHSLLGLKDPGHDLNHIPQYTDELDPEPWMTGLHLIKPQLVKHENDYANILGQETVEQIDTQWPAFWGIK